MEDLVFIKRKVGGLSNDISITVNGKDKKKSVSLYFRNGVENLITNGRTDYVVVAVLGNRLYFKKADPSEGYKICYQNRSDKSKRVQISGNVAPHLLRFAEHSEGEYPLSYDNERNLHYIEAE